MPVDLRKHFNDAVRATASWGLGGSGDQDGTEGPGDPGGPGLPVYDDDGRVDGLAAQGVRPTGDVNLDDLLARPSYVAHVQVMRDVAVVAAADPDRALADWLEDLEAVSPGVVPAAVLVEAVAASVRLESAAHARTARLAAALARCPEMDPSWNRVDGPLPAQRSVAADELAMRLGTSRPAANRLVRQGLAFDGQLQATGEALACGQLDAAKAELLVSRLADLPGQVGMAVEDRVLPGADRRSLAELRLQVERALREVDPQAAAERHVHARTTRQVSRPRVEADGMASMWLVLAAEDAARVDGVLEHAARAARAAGDPRTLAQARADGLRDLVVGDVPAGPVGPSAAPVASLAAPSSPSGCSCGGTGRPGSQVRVTVSASTLLGLDDLPGDLEGHGPIDAVAARALAADGVWRRVVTDPASGTVLDVGRTRYRPPAALAEHVRVRDRHCAAPGCTVPARRCDVDHTTEYRRQRGSSPGTRDSDPHDGPHGEVSGVPHGDPREVSGVPHGDPHGDPREVSGVPHGGPLGGVSGDPLDGDGDLGTTSADNLGLLCRRHHRLKTDGGFRLRQVAPGVYAWITPSGHRYLTRPGTDDVADVTAVPPDEPPPF